jgi:uncharacterized RDD family membrane protein YckC
MPSVAVRDPDGLVFERPLANAGSRFGAALLDALLLALVVLFALLTTALFAGFDPTGASAFVLGLIGGGSLLLLIGYQAAFGLLWRGQTPGKVVFGLRALSADGRPAQPMQHLLRALVWPLDVFLPVPLPFGQLGLALVVGGARRQRLGDLVAGTVVVREARPQVASTSAARRSPKAGTLTTARSLDLHPGLAARLDDEDRSFLRDLLARGSMEPSERRRLFVAAGRHYAARLGLGPFSDARALLESVEAFARRSRAAGD